MANYLDFLVVVDEHIRPSSLGRVIHGHELEDIARAAGILAANDIHSPARWAGECVAFGYLKHSQQGRHDRRPVTQGAYTPDELRRFTDWCITPEGRTEADRVRREQRESLTDSALGGFISELGVSSMSEPHRNAITVALANLRSALDNERHVAAVGFAKDLVEAACKVVLDRAGEQPSGSLHGMF